MRRHRLDRGDGGRGRLGASHRPEGTGTQADRTLVTYPDDASAQRALEQIESAVASCVTEPVNATQAVDPVPVDRTLDADDSLVFTRRYLDTDPVAYTGELQVWQVARTGHALLVTTSAGAGPGGDDRLVREEVERLADRLGPVLADLEQHFG